MRMTRRNLFRTMAGAAVAILVSWLGPRLVFRRGWILRSDDT